MLNIVVPLQGQLILAEEKTQGPSYHQLQWFDLLILQKQGAMTPEQFDEKMTDLVNFLAYASEPYRIKQMHLGYRVIGFLLVFFVLAYLLKQAYWKELKKRK
jgi:cytochrome c1